MKACRQLRRRLTDSRGFTLAELLMVILILLLVSTVVATGVPAAVNAYQKVVDSANAQLLLSTTVSSLRRELSLAGEVGTDGSNGVEYYINGQGQKLTVSDDDLTIEAKFILTSDEDGIKRTWLIDNEGKEIIPKAITLAGRGNDIRMVPKFDSLTYENGFFTVEKLQIEKDGSTAAGPIDLKIQTFAVEETTDEP
ncbi:MAG: prepilin-type N-terminal cleavage/methylation domain-containing protein [Eubacteriales bacterium]|nr:prepilin-type N-terminal cleavage/methylation domain-containing protein [Eubacteriales bacterium]